MDPRTRFADGTEVAGRFKVIGYIDRGGMASVYRAEQLRLDRRVALKILDESLAHEPARVARFRREARDAARLDHPHVVSIIDADESDGIFWIAMDLIEGTNLGQRFADRDHPISPRELLRTLTQIASALDYAHQDHGLIHRDLKPQNILIQRSTGRAFLADFGIATGHEHTHHTAVGETMGTYRYVAPEQILPNGPKASPATDVYALAIVAYQGLTGAPSPYAGVVGDVQMFHAHLYSDPVQLTGEEPVVSALNEVFATGLAKDPDDRFHSAGEFVAELVAAFDNRADLLDRRPGFPHPLADDQADDLPPAGTAEATILASQHTPVNDTDEIPTTGQINDVDQAPSTTEALQRLLDEPSILEPPTAPIRSANDDVDDPEQMPGTTAALQQLLDEPPILAPQAPQTPRVRSTADLPARPRDTPPPPGRRAPRPRRWPLVLATGSLALPVAALALTDRKPDPRPTLTDARAGAASLQVPAAATPTRPTTLLERARMTAPKGAATAAVSSAGQTAAVVTIADGRPALSPPKTTAAADTVQLGGGRGRRYTTPGGTVTIASTPKTVVWLLCSAPAGPGPCAAATRSLRLDDAEDLQADPVPSIATAVRDALAAPQKARADLQLPAAKLASRKGRAEAIADAYRRGAGILRTAAAARPRDRDLAALRDALQTTAGAYDAIAAASRRTGRGADRRALTRLRSADTSTQTTLKRLQARGYPVQR